ncbi:MAG: hypothetical protein JO021_14880, partial [Alphaproteobacteria bacterium]|nr:hypothetical protein [Alphaproteobacteria bacterium]
MKPKSRAVRDVVVEFVLPRRVVGEATARCDQHAQPGGPRPVSGDRRVADAQILQERRRRVVGRRIGNAAAHAAALNHPVGVDLRQQPVIATGEPQQPRHLREVAGAPQLERADAQLDDPARLRFERHPLAVMRLEARGIAVRQRDHAMADRHRQGAAH